ncbi:hypothetical protein ACEPAF_1995 [Sanghuangporus sanghuang]
MPRLHDLLEYAFTFHDARVPADAIDFLLTLIGRKDCPVEAPQADEKRLVLNGTDEALCVYNRIKRESNQTKISILRDLIRELTMMHIATTALLLFFSVGTPGTSVASGALQSRGLASCPSAVVVNSTTVNVNGNEIKSTTFECPDDNLSARDDESSLVARFPVIIPNTLSHVAKRNAAECKTAAPECQCGQPTTCACTNPTPNAPTGLDCTILIDSLQIIPQLQGSTFVVQPRTFQLLQFESCAIEFSNLANGIRNQPLEYCWDEMSALMGLSNQDCLEDNVSSGASCTPNDGLWNLQLFRVSS